MSETSGYGGGNITGFGSDSNKGLCLGKGMIQADDDGSSSVAGSWNNGGGYDDCEGYGCGTRIGDGSGKSRDSNFSGYG